jgi:hypothetical protein
LNFFAVCCCVCFSGGLQAQSWIAAGAGTNNWLSLTASTDGSKLSSVAFLGPLSHSGNYGLNWTNFNSLDTNYFYSLAGSADGNVLVAASYGSWLYASKNAGLTWVPATNAPATNWNAVAASADGTKLVAAASPGGIYRSMDAGADWLPLTNSSFAFWRALACSADGVTVAAVPTSSQVSNAVWVSTDSGATWRAHGVPAPGTNATIAWGGVASSADGTRLVAAARPGPVFLSTNSGVAWFVTTNAPSTNWYAVASSADGTRLIAAAYGGSLYLSTDAGVTWSTKNSPVANWYTVAASADGSLLGGAAYGGPLYLYQKPRPPLLSIAGSGRGVVISWPAAATTFTNLQSSTNLAGGTWAVVTNLPTVTNQMKQVLITNVVGNEFYRLKGLAQ